MLPGFLSDNGKRYFLLLKAQFGGLCFAMEPKTWSLEWWDGRDLTLGFYVIALSSNERVPITRKNNILVQRSIACILTY